MSKKKYSNNKKNTSKKKNKKKINYQKKHNKKKKIINQNNVIKKQNKKNNNKVNNKKNSNVKKNKKHINKKNNNQKQENKKNYHKKHIINTQNKSNLNNLNNIQKKEENIKVNDIEEVKTKINDINKSINETNLLDNKSNKEKKNNNFSLILINIIIFLATISAITIVVINYNIKINLIGPKEETIEVFSEYNDKGYNATLFNKNINNKVKTTTDLNTNELGSYTITYNLSLLSLKKVTRKINVVDTTSPTITLNGNSTINIYINDEYTDEGVTIKDNYDTDLSQNLIIENNLDVSKKGTYTITYTVHDSSNNIASIERTINVKEKQIITTNNKSCNLSNPIENYICTNNYNVSIEYYNLVNNKTYYYNKNATYYGASLIKTLDALYLYDKNLINDDLKEYVKKAISVSDNPSHQYLVNYIGFDNLKQYGISIGAKNTLIGGDNFGITTVNDQIAVMKKLYAMTKDNQNEELKSFFINSYYNNLLFEDCPTIMHKYGWWKQVFHNSGIVLDENPYIVVILTSEGYDNYSKIISTLSKLVYEYHKTN